MGESLNLLVKCAALPRTGSFRERLDILLGSRNGNLSKKDVLRAARALLAHDSQDESLRQGCLADLCCAEGVFGKNVQSLLEKELQAYGLVPAPELLGGLSMLLSQAVFSEYRIIYLQLLDKIGDETWFETQLRDLAFEISLVYACLVWQKSAILKFEEAFQQAILQYLKKKFYYYYNTIGLKIPEAYHRPGELPEIYDFILDGLLFTGDTPDYDWLGRLLSPGWGKELPPHNCSYPSCRLASYDPRKNKISGFLLNVFSCRGSADTFERILRVKFSYSIISGKKADGKRSRMLTAPDNLTFSYRQLTDTYDPGLDRLQVSSVDFVNKYKNNPFLKYQAKADDCHASPFYSNPHDVYEIMIERGDMNRRFLKEVQMLLGSENCWLLEQYYRLGFSSQKISSCYKTEFGKPITPDNVRKRISRSLERVRDFAGRHPLWREYFDG